MHWISNLWLLNSKVPDRWYYDRRLEKLSVISVADGFAWTWNVNVSLSAHLSVCRRAYLQKRHTFSVDVTSGRGLVLFYIIYMRYQRSSLWTMSADWAWTSLSQMTRAGTIRATHCLGAWQEHMKKSPLTWRGNRRQQISLAAGESFWAYALFPSPMPRRCVQPQTWHDLHNRRYIANCSVVKGGQVAATANM